MMIKVLLVLAVMLGAAVALDLATATKTSELDGMTNEVLAMVGSAIAEIEQNEELTPNATEAAALLKNAQENPNIAYVDMAYLADINFLVNLRNNQKATIDAATTAYLTYRSTVKAQLEAFLTVRALPISVVRCCGPWSPRVLILLLLGLRHNYLMKLLYRRSSS